MIRLLLFPYLFHRTRHAPRWRQLLPLSPRPLFHDTSRTRGRFLYPIQRWAASGAAEGANYQLFLSELCTLLEVPPPEPTRPDDAENAYVFERNVHFVEDDGSASIGRIDLYNRGHFVLEAKQGSDADVGRLPTCQIHGRLATCPTIHR